MDLPFELINKGFSLCDVEILGLYNILHYIKDVL